MRLLAGAVLLALSLLAPQLALPPLSTTACAILFVWQAFEDGDGLRRKMYILMMQVQAAPIVLTVLPLATAFFLLRYAAQRTDPFHSVPQVVPMYRNASGVATLLEDALVVLSSCTSGGRFDESMVEASLGNKRRYCALTDRPRNLSTGSRVRCALFNQSTSGPHHAKWEKYIRIREEMMDSREAWFMWIDCDAVFTSASFDWEALLLDNPNVASGAPLNVFARDFVLARDRNGFNTGIFFLRNTAWSLGFLNAMLELQLRVDLRVSADRPRDQRALGELLRADHLLAHHIRVVPQRTINAFFSHDGGQGARWQPGDWIAHQVDCKRPECNPEFTQIAALL